MTRQQWFSSLLQSRSGTTSAVESGEHTIDVRLRHDPAKKDYWTLEETILGRGTGSVGTEMPWLNDRRAWSIGGDVSIGKQQEFDPAGGIVLFALRQGVVKEINGGYSTMGADASKELPGVMFWIAPADSGP